jgi:hypothetical protein
LLSFIFVYFHISHVQTSSYFVHYRLEAMYPFRTQHTVYIQGDDDEMKEKMYYDAYRSSVNSASRSSSARSSALMNEACARSLHRSTCNSSSSNIASAFLFDAFTSDSFPFVSRLGCDGPASFDEFGGAFPTKTILSVRRRLAHNESDRCQDVPFDNFFESHVTRFVAGGSSTVSFFFFAGSLFRTRGPFLLHVIPSQKHPCTSFLHFTHFKSFGSISHNSLLTTCFWQ